MPAPISDALIDRTISKNKKIVKIEKDVGVLTENVRGLKKDVSGLKKDVGDLKVDVRGLKRDVGSINDELRRQGVMWEQLESKVDQILDVVLASQAKLELVTHHEAAVCSFRESMDRLERSMYLHLADPKAHSANARGL